MTQIRVPLDVYNVTLVINGIRHPPAHWTEGGFAAVLAQANTIWAQADICFFQQSFSGREVELLNRDSNVVVTSGDQQYLASRLRGQQRLSVILVDQARSRDPAAGMVGGVAMEQFRACVLAWSGNWSAAGRYLAHEFGHLLGLHDLMQNPADAGNLMWGAVGDPASAVLNADQRTTARGRAGAPVTPPPAARP